MSSRSSRGALGRALSAALLLTGLAAAAARAQSGGYTFRTLPVNQDQYPVAYGINNAGQVVGFYNGAPYSAFVSSAGQATTLDLPDAGSTQAYGINNRGQIVGNDYEYFGNQSFLYSAGTFSTFQHPSTYGTETDARGINDAGTVAGYFQSDGGSYQGFLYNSAAGTFSDFSVPGADVDATYAYGINNLGEVVGSYYDVDGLDHGYTYDSNTGTFSVLNVPGAVSTDAYGVNDLGQVVGTYVPDSDYPGAFAGTVRAFVYGGGVFTTFDHPGAIDGDGYVYGTYANGINAAGEIAGYYVGPDGNSHVFVADPTAAVTSKPEPAAYALLVPGLLVVGAAAERRSRRQRSLQ